MDNDYLDQALSTLNDAGIVAHATETCYGLACDLTNPDAVQRLFDAKKRPYDMPVSALFASLEQATQYLEWNELADQLARDHLPGPLTIILRQKHDTPHQLFPSPSPSPSPTVGLRLSPHETALALVTAFGKPIATTSANLHGKPSPYSVEEITAEADLVIDDGVLPEAPPSTVVDASDGALHVLRSGDVVIENQ